MVSPYRRSRTYSFTGRNLLLAACLTGSMAHAQQSRFSIWKGDDVIGSVLARRTVSADRTHYLMTSFSEFDLIWKHNVRSLVSTEYLNGELATCHSNMRVNGDMRDSSHFAPGAASAHCFVHPDERFMHRGRVEWTTARMYFEEPVQQGSIFVESVLKDCPLEAIGEGRYQLTLPDDRRNRYSYRNGQLEEIHVDRGFFDLVFKRDR